MSGTRFEGSTPSGTRYRIDIPRAWNDVLLLYSRGLPTEPDDAPWEEDEPLFQALAAEGYAVAGSGGPMFWPLEDSFRNQDALLDTFAREVGDPRRTIAFGYSIGGIITAGLVQVMPDRLSGALPMCGNLAGAVAVHNRELDVAFVVRTLLAPGSLLQLVGIEDPERNFGLARALLEQEQRTPEGQARLALAAAVGNIPGWHGPVSPEPAPDDLAARQRNRMRWLEEPGFLVFFLLRAQVEAQAGGNPSWNTAVDYGELLRRSIARADVEALYENAGLELEADLETLASAPRIEADPGAVEYLERHIAFDGRLGDVPVVTLHTDGDGLVTPDNEHAYSDVVERAGDGDLLRRLGIHRGGHCTFSAGETLVALNVLRERIDSGTWPSVEPADLNALARSLAAGRRELTRGGGSVEPAFFDFHPRPFSRPHDLLGRS